MASQTKEPGLTKSEKKKFYKSLVTKNFAEAASIIGLDKRYTNPSSLRSKAYQVYKEIDPIELGIPKDVVDMVQEAIEGRKFASRRVITEKDDSALIDPSDTKEIVIGGRNKAAMLIHKKMDILDNDKRALDKENLGTLAKVFGIFFDKAQIVQGQATENIAVMAKISEDMSPEQTLDALLTMRESNQETKDSK